MAATSSDTSSVGEPRAPRRSPRVVLGALVAAGVGLVCRGVLAAVAEAIDLERDHLDDVYDWSGGPGATSAASGVSVRTSSTRGGTCADGAGPGVPDVSAHAMDGDERQVG